MFSPILAPPTEKSFPRLLVWSQTEVLGGLIAVSQSM